MANPIIHSETKDFHPIVAEWLNEHGYEYEHEVQMPDYGRADFVAIHKEDKHLLIVECKVSGRVENIITQVSAYALQYDNALKAIAIPSSLLDEKAQRIATKYDVQILTFDVVVVSKREKYDGMRELIRDYIKLQKDNDLLTDEFTEAIEEMQRTNQRLSEKIADQEKRLADLERRQNILIDDRPYSDDNEYLQ